MTTARDRESLTEIELARRLRAAYGPGAGCPPPEIWHRAALGEPAADERARLADHAAGCPACAAERDLAAAFVAGPDPAAAGDVAAVVAHLAARPPHRPAAGVAAADGARNRSGAGPVESAPAPTRERPAGTPREAAAPEPLGERPAAVRPAARPGGRLLRFPRLAGAAAAVLAAAAALVLALGLGAYVLRAPQPPPLPDRPAGGGVRGAIVTGLAPTGELDAAPAALTWEPVGGAASYRVTLFAADDAVLWRGEAAGPPAPLPGAVMPLSSAVVYGWSVEAIDAGGRPSARSERASFLIRPEPEGAPAAPPESEG